MPGDNGAATYKKLKQINSEIEVLVSSGFCKDLNVSEILKAVRIVSFRNLSNSKSLPIK
jgi:DNA-binding NarL/FixJ family response regulator